MNFRLILFVSWRKHKSIDHNMWLSFFVKDWWLVATCCLGAVCSSNWFDTQVVETNETLLLFRDKTCFHEKQTQERDAECAGKKGGTNFLHSMETTMIGNHKNAFLLLSNVFKGSQNMKQCEMVVTRPKRVRSGFLSHTRHSRLCTWVNWPKLMRRKWVFGNWHRQCT